MTEEELIQFLRIPEISTAANYRNVIANLKRAHGLPRVHLCGKTVYLRDSVKEWLRKHVTYGQQVHVPVQCGLDQPKPCASIGKEVDK
jgi:hypothetical protein